LFSLHHFFDVCIGVGVVCDVAEGDILGQVRNTAKDPK